MTILTSDDVKNMLNDLSEDWAKKQEQAIILEEGKKAMFSKCVIKHKQFVKTNSEAEHEARIDPEYKKIVQEYAKAEGELIKARYAYNNTDREISFKQTEMKLELSKA